MKYYLRQLYSILLYGLYISALQNSDLLANSPCGHPSVPLHAFYLTVNSSVLYFCDDGYKLLGNNFKICESDGNWNGSDPMCVTEVARYKPVPTISSKISELNDQSYIQNCEFPKQWKVDLLQHYTIKAVELTWADGFMDDTLQINIANLTSPTDVAQMCKVTAVIEKLNQKMYVCDEAIQGDSVSIFSYKYKKMIPLPIYEVRVFAINSEEVLPYEACMLPEQAIPFGNKCFTLHKTELTYEDQTLACQIDGGQLLSDPSDSLKILLKQYFLHNIFGYEEKCKDTMLCRPYQPYFWINLSFEETDGVQFDNQSKLYSFWKAPDCPMDSTWIQYDTINSHEKHGAICQYEPVTCGSPDRLSRSYIQDLNYSVGQSVNYVCDPGYSTNDNITRTCLPFGHWSGRAPHCLSQGFFFLTGILSPFYMIGLLMLIILLVILLMLIYYKTNKYRSKSKEPEETSNLVAEHKESNAGYLSANNVISPHEINRYTECNDYTDASSNQDNNASPQKGFITSGCQYFDRQNSEIDENYPYELAKDRKETSKDNMKDNILYDTF